MTTIVRFVDISGIVDGDACDLWSRLPPDFSGVHVTRPLDFYVMFCRSTFVLLSIFSAIVLSVLLRFTASDYPSVIFKLVLTITVLNESTFC